MLPRELQTAINHLSPESRRVAEAIVIFYEDYYGGKLMQLEARLKELEDRLAQNSRNSNKPPSSDVFNKPAPKSLRKKTGRKSGGQKGHDGNTLKMVEHPDATVVHGVEVCDCCGKSLQDQVADKIERRQVYDVPALQILVTEHQSEVKECVCGHVNRGIFPAEVNRYVQYGPNVRSMLLYMQDYQLMPYERSREFFRDLFGHKFSSGTFYNIRQGAYDRLEDSQVRLKASLTKASVAGFDETGIRVDARIHWLHVCSTSKHAYFEVHSKRGHQAMEDIGILPKFEGVAVHDFWKSYFRYGCQHGLCAPHLLRELIFVYDRNKQLWAKELLELLVKMKDAKDKALAQGKVHFSSATKQFYRRCYEDLIEKGLADNPLDPSPPKSRGRSKQSKARNLLERFRDYPEEVLRFFFDFKVPFDNNQSERDLRMGKVKQKISGCFRSLEGAMYFARIRSYITTARKQDFNAFYALRDLFEGRTLALQLVGAE